ncbi:hypothetical protein GCM10023220_29510 [Streptomyces ziwulingensis]|uniref:Uncharacterized protein n=1 Tax=Streptomyces ziwulingensis TaxID=1045501 RepID=A0ABP9BTM2_9ACTN
MTGQYEAVDVGCVDLAREAPSCTDRPPQIPDEATVGGAIERALHVVDFVAQCPQQDEDVVPVHAGKRGDEH